MNNRDVITEFMNMIKCSWTWERMTKEEKQKFFDDVILHKPTMNVIKGTFKQRWELLNQLYHTYLIGIGYNGFEWREN